MSKLNIGAKYFIPCYPSAMLVSVHHHHERCAVEPLVYLMRLSMQSAYCRTTILSKYDFNISLFTIGKSFKL